MKKYLAMLIGVAVVILAIPAVVGQMLKYQIKDRLENEVWPQGYRAQIEHYSTGWLSSNISVVLARGNNAAPALGASEIPLDLKIFHGPLIYTTNLQGNSSLIFALGVARGVAKVKNQQMLANIDLQLFAKFDFNKVVEADLIGSNYHEAENNIFDLNIANINSHFVLEGQHLFGQSAIQNLKVSAHNLMISIPSGQANYDLQKSLSSIWLGQRSAFVPAITITEANKPIFSMNQLSSTSSSELNGTKINGGFQLKIAKLTFEQHDNAGPINLNYSGKNYNAAKVEQLMTALANMEWQAQNQAQNMQNSQHIAQLLLGVLPGTVHQMKFAAKTAKGDINLNSSLDFAEQMQTLPATSLDAMAASLLTGTTAMLHVDIPTQFYNDILNQMQTSRADAESMVAALQSVGAVKVVNSQMQSDIRYQNNQVTINGIALQQIIAQLKTMQPAEQASTVNPAQPTIPGGVVPAEEQSSPSHQSDQAGHLPSTQPEPQASIPAKESETKPQSPIGPSAAIKMGQPIPPGTSINHEPHAPKSALTETQGVASMTQTLSQAQAKLASAPAPSVSSAQTMPAPAHSVAVSHEGQG